MRALFVLAGIQFVELFSCFEGVFIHRVVVIEVVLDKQAGTAKLRHKTDQESFSLSWSCRPSFLWNDTHKPMKFADMDGCTVAPVQAPLANRFRPADLRHDDLL